jgi:hypothetical protein
MPYGDYGRAHHPAVIADMNAAHLAFSLFDGANKNGSDPCYADPHPEDPANPTPDKAVADATRPAPCRTPSDRLAEAQNHWVSLTVDAHDPNVLTFEKHLIAATSRPTPHRRPSGKLQNNRIRMRAGFVRMRRDRMDSGR